MNIVCILGNGIDLNLGLKTSYADFYECYLDQPEPEEASVQKLREEIRADLPTWADLEIALGVHCKHLEDADDATAVFFDISERLAEYLELQEETCDYSSKNSERFIRDTLSPESYLTPREKADYSSLRSGIVSRISPGSKTKIDILTFNYTRSIERVLGDSEELKSKLESVEKNVVFGTIDHIHGKIGETPILGLNDESQVLNEELAKSIDAMEVCIKQKHSDAIGALTDNRCANIIGHANVLIIFGSSLGETDKLWWERIGNRLRSDCLLFLFIHSSDFDVPSSRIAMHNKFKRNIKKQFLAKTSLSENELEIILPKIFVGINKSIYSL